MNKNKVLEIKDLTVLIKERFLVKDINFSMEEGECFGLIGEEKSGKTSLLKAISGSLPISTGNVLIEGEDITENPDILKCVNICLDPPMFFKYQTVFENMRYLSMLSENCDKEKIIKVLNKFNLGHKLKTRVLFLSYYEKKLMALALAFLTQPKLLLLDEPFKSLPPENEKIVKNYLKDIRSQGTSIIISSNNVEKLENICEKFIFMENRGIKKILTNIDFSQFDDIQNYAFVEVKYPHYAGKLIMDNFDLPVKLLGKKVLFEADEDSVADIVRYITKKEIAISKAGYLSNKAEKIFGQLTPYFKEDSQ